MARPSVTFTILSNGLGNAPASPSNTVHICGCSASGTANSTERYVSTPGDVITDFGYGPGPELVANLVASGVEVYFTKVVTNTAGVATAVTHTGTGLSSMTTTGAPLDLYDIVVLVTRAGTVGTDPEPGVEISFDGGVTWTRETRMPASGVIDTYAAQTGLTFTFTAATLVEGDTYELTSTAPTWQAADVAAALEAFRTSKYQASLQYVVGACTKSQADTVATEIDTFLARKKFVGLVLESRDINSGETEAQWMTALSNDFATFENNRICVAAGYALVQSVVSANNYRRSIGWLAILRACTVKFGRSVGAVEDGALVPFYQGGEGNNVSTVYHDEGLTPGLDDNRFMTVTSYNGLDGYYITRPLMMASSTSDFSELQYRRVMDETCRVTNIFFTKKLNTDVRLEGFGARKGFILERDARSLESGNDTEIRKAVINTGNASPMAGYTTVSRSDNISTTKTLTVTVKILPLGYLEQIPVTMTFINPALAA